MSDRLKVFNNEKFGVIRITNIDGEYWIIGKDVIEKLGYDVKNVTYSKYIKRYCDAEDYIFVNRESPQKIKDSIDYRQLGQRGGYIINEKGLLSLVQFSIFFSSPKKQEFLDLLYNEKIISKKYLLSYQRKEIRFLNNLEEALRPFRIKGEEQYHILKYRIDYYISSLNIAIEYDENDHEGYTYEEHEGRQKEIEEELGCRFIRVSDRNSDEYNIGLVIKEIFNITL